MIVDVHVHVFPPEILPSINTYLETDPFLKTICTSPGHKYASLEDLVAAMEKGGVDKALAGGFASSDPGLCSIMNDYVLEGARKYPGKIFPMISLSPDQFSGEEIDRCLDQGAVGVGELFPWGQKFDLQGKAAERLACCCQERNLPLLLHINEEVGHYYAGKGEVSVKEAVTFAQQHPELTIIYAHWGGGMPFYELMPELKGKLSHVYYDISAGPFLYTPDIYRVVREIGIMDKVLLGTDYPLISPGRYYREMKKAGLTAEEINLICGENARKIWGF